MGEKGMEMSEKLQALAAEKAAQGGAQPRPQNQASFDGSDLLGLLSMLK